MISFAIQAILNILKVNDLIFCSLTGSIHETYPDVKIILNEITPRNDNRDEHVIQCNTKLQTYTSRHDHVFLQGRVTLETIAIHSLMITST